MSGLFPGLNVTYLKLLLQCRLGECAFLHLDEGHFLLIVGCLIDEGWVGDAVTLIQNHISTERLENGVPGLQGVEIFILKREDLILS